MKAIDACNVRFDAAKVILFVLMFALVITLLSAGEPGGHLSERPHPEEGHHAAGHALQVEIKLFSFFHMSNYFISHDHLRNISQRLMLLRRTEEAAKYLEATKLQTSNGYSEEFTVMDDLMGLAIGGRIKYFLVSQLIFSSVNKYFSVN